MSTSLIHSSPDALLCSGVCVAFMDIMAGAMVEGSDSPAGSGAASPSLPMSPLHSLDRLIRSLFLTSLDQHQPLAILLLYFSSNQRWHHRSVQSAHDRVARHYGIHSVSYRDHVTHPAVRVPLPVEQPDGVMDQGHYYDGDETIHPNPQGHWVMGQLLIRAVTRLYDNYHTSHRSSLADPWMLSGRVASTSVRMKDREAAQQQAADEVTELSPLNIDRAWRLQTDIEQSAVDDWQARVSLSGSRGSGGGEEEEVGPGETEAEAEAEAEMILPAILSTDPLPLPPALHPLNQHLPPYFHCRKTYMIYIGDHAYQPYDHVERWFGVVHPTPQPALTPLPPPAHNASVDYQWLFGSSPKHPAKYTFSPHPHYLAALTTQPTLPLPEMTITIPVVQHSASLFYLRTWQAMATAEAHLFCSASPSVKSAVQVLNGTWSSPTSQASATVIYYRGGGGGGDDHDTGTTTPPCYDRIHIQLKQPGDFRIIGYAVA
jgi:hypothetical protein